MKFTDNSLNIRIFKDAPWISLLPSTEPMSPEERAVDAVRKDVMDKIALLWGGLPDNSSDENDSGQRSSHGSSTEANTSRSRRARSRRSRRAEQNGRSNHRRRNSTTISGNTIDSSTHTTTNNYYGCIGSHPHSPHADVREEAISSDYLENLASQFKRIIDNDTKTLSNRDQSTNTEDSVKRDTSTNTVPKNLKSTSTEIDPNVFPEKTRASVDHEVQTQQDLFKEESIHSSTQSIHSFEDVISTEDISNLNQFVNDSLIETEAFIEIASNIEDELDPQLISSILTNRTILQELQGIIVSDPKLIIGSDKIDALLNQLDLETLQLIHNNPTLEIPYLNQEDSSSDSSTLVNSTEASVESEDSEDSFIDDEIKDQPIPTYMQSSESFSSEDSDDDSETLFDGIQNWINNPIYIQPTNDKETQSVSRQTGATSTEEDEESYTTEELKAEIGSLVYDLESYKEVIASSNKRADEQFYKNQESARKILNLLDQQGILEKIIKNLDTQLDNAKSINKRLFSENDNLKKEIDRQDRRGIDAETKASYLAQELANSDRDLKELLNSLASYRKSKLSPKTDESSPVIEDSPILEEAAVKNTTRTPSKVMTSKVTIPVEEKSKPKRKLPIQAKPTTSFESDINALQRKLMAMQIGALRSKKAALEIRLKNLSRADRMKAEELLKHLNDELVRRNQKPQKSSASTMTKESKTKLL